MDDLADWRSGRLESQGHFEVDLQAQARKVCQYNPGLPLLKFVQAAVASCAPAVHLELGRSEERVCFRPCSPNWVERVREGFRLAGSSVPIQQNETIQLTISRPKLAWWQWLKPDLRKKAIIALLERHCAFCPIPVWLGKRRLNHLRPERLEGGGERVQAPWFEGGPDSYFWLAERYRLAEDGFCLVAPAVRPAARLLVNGRSAPGGSLDPVALLSCPETALRLEEHRVRARFGGKDSLLDQLESGIVLPLGVTVSPTDTLPYVLDARLLRGSLRTDLWDSINTTWRWGYPAPAVKLDRWVGLPILPGSQSYLYYVQDGILLNPVPVETGLTGSCAVLHSRLIKTDASSLNVVHDEVVEADRLWLLSEERTLESLARPLLAEAQSLKLRREVVTFWTAREWP